MRGIWGFENVRVESEFQELVAKPRWEALLAWEEALPRLSRPCDIKFEVQQQLSG